MHDLCTAAPRLPAGFARYWRNGRKVLLAFAMAGAALQVQAQAHDKRVGAYVLRASVVASQTFDAATARAHGIDPDPRRAVLNVTLMRVDGRRSRNVRGEVRASAAELTGRRQDIDLRPIEDNGMVSYLGVFDFAPKEVLQFRIVARPPGGGGPIRLNFGDRIWVPLKPRR